MFRNRLLLATLAAFMMLPLMGCRSSKCCGGSSSYRPASYYPVAPAAPCNSCQTTSSATPIVYNP